MDFDIKTKKVRATTMFEINDSGREHEYSRRGKTYDGVYIKPFIEFLESLGYEITYKYGDTPGLTSNIIIDGVEFGIDAGNATYATYDIYKRKRSVRKPENRYVALERGYSRPVACRVHINKELDTENLKARINKAIKEEQDRDKAIEDRDKLTYDNTIATAMHYLKNKRIKEFTNFTYINRSVMNFNLKDGSCVSIDTQTGALIKAILKVDEIETAEAMDELVLTISNRSRKFRDIVNLIISTAPMQKGLADWTVDQHHIYFYTKTMSPENS